MVPTGTTTNEEAMTLMIIQKMIDEIERDAR